MTKRKTKTSQAHRRRRIDPADETLLSAWAHAFRRLGDHQPAGPIQAAPEREFPDNFAKTFGHRLRAMIDRLDRTSRRLDRVAALIARPTASGRSPPTVNRATRRRTR